MGNRASRLALAGGSPREAVGIKSPEDKHVVIQADSAAEGVADTRPFVDAGGLLPDGTQENRREGLGMFLDVYVSRDARPARFIAAACDDLEGRPRSWWYAREHVDPRVLGRHMFHEALFQPAPAQPNDKRCGSGRERRDLVLVPVGLTGARRRHVNGDPLGWSVERRAAPEHQERGRRAADGEGLH